MMGYFITNISFNLLVKEFKIGEHLEKLQAKRLIVSCAPFALEDSRSCYTWPGWRSWVGPIYSLERQRLRGDLIETFKILTGREHVNYSKFFELADVISGLRGHSLKLFKPRCRTTVRQNFFSLRIASEWNKLPQDIVEAQSIITSKNRLDRHLHDMGIQSWRLHYIAHQPQQASK